MNSIRIDEHITLSEVTINDINSFIEHLNNKEIYNNTLTIPYPYTKEDGEWFINHVTDLKNKYNQTVNWAIRNSEEKLIGGIGFHEIIGHKAEIGYWLAEPYWGKSIMKGAINKVCEIGFNNFGLSRITANVFEKNIRSAKVLEKCGFELEAICLKNHYKKDGKIFNGKLYAKTI